jgi:hypothetical protein
LGLESARRRNSVFGVNGFYAVVAVLAHDL